MKWMTLLIWLTQLSISVVGPLGGFVLLSVWLRNKFDLGVWIVIAGIVIGVICAVDGLKASLKTMNKMAQPDERKETPLSFNDHE